MLDSKSLIANGSCTSLLANSGLLLAKVTHMALSVCESRGKLVGSSATCPEGIGAAAPTTDK